MTTGNQQTFAPVEKLEGSITVPGDKSISHRALFIAAIASGISKISNLLIANDTMSTAQCLRSLGTNIAVTGTDAVVTGNGISGFTEPSGILDAGNSGTTARIILGLLSTQDFFSVLTGDDSLRTRPMKRVAIPLTAMGSIIDGRDHANYLPVSVRGTRLKGIDYTMPAASAQVKTGLMLASLGAKGVMTIREPVATRDHTERMLAASGVDVKVSDTVVQLVCSQKPLPVTMTVPGDFSSAAFFIGAGIIAHSADILITKVGINPGRTGFIDIMRQMGGTVEITNMRFEAGEPVADIRVRPSNLKGTVIEDRRLIARAIDELPLVAVCAAFAQGTTLIKNAEELRVKETDRIKTVVDGLVKVGIKAREFRDGISIEGGTVRGGSVSSFGDHRIAMAFAVASVSSEREISIDNFSAVNISFPGFLPLFNTLRRA